MQTVPGNLERVKENEPVSQAFGVPNFRVKIRLFCISSDNGSGLAISETAESCQRIRHIIIQNLCIARSRFDLAVPNETAHQLEVSCLALHPAGDGVSVGHAPSGLVTCDLRRRTLIEGRCA